MNTEDKGSILLRPAPGGPQGECGRPPLAFFSSLTRQLHVSDTEPPGMVALLRASTSPLCTLASAHHRSNATALPKGAVTSNGHTHGPPLCPPPAGALCGTGECLLDEPDFCSALFPHLRLSSFTIFKADVWPFSCISLTDLTYTRRCLQLGPPFSGHPSSPNVNSVWAAFTATLCRDCCKTTQGLLPQMSSSCVAPIIKDLITPRMRCLTLLILHSVWSC